MSDLHRPESIPSFLIWGGWYGSRNIGDTAILLGLKELIHEHYPNDAVYIRALSTDIDYTSTNGVTGERALIKSDIFRIWPWFNIFRVFRKPDKIVISGGTPVFDSSHTIRFFYLFLTFLFKKPFVVFGAGIKPINSTFARRYLSFFLKRADYVSARDHDSKLILEELGVMQTELTADSAFFALPESPNVVHEELAQYGIAYSDSLLVVAPRLLSGERKRLYLEEHMDQKLISETPEVLAEVIDQVAGDFDTVLLVAMHFYGPDSDVPIIRKILDKCQCSNIVFLDHEIRPELAIGIFKRADLLLGVRLHSILLAASMGTPVIGIAYEQKVKSLFERLEISEFCFDLFQLESSQLIQAVENARNRSEELSEHLSKRVQDLKELVRMSASKAFRI